MKKFLSVAVLLLLTITVLAGCGSKNDEEQVKTNPKPLVVSMDLAHPPFEMKDEKENPTGVSVDFIKAFGEYVGREVKIQPVSEDQLIPSLQQEKADLVMSSLFVTEDGKQLVDFSEPYAQIELAVLVKKNEGLSSAESLNQKEKKVAVIAGSAGEIYARKNLSDAEITALADENACVSQVLQGKADAFISDQLMIYSDWKNYADQTDLLSVGNQEVGKWAIAVQKGDTALLAQVNEFIETYRINGGFNKLTSKYLVEEKEDFDRFGLNWIFNMDE